MDYTQPITNFGEALGFGGMMVLIGMAAIFAVLFIIYLSLVIFKLVFQGATPKKKPEPKVVVSTPAPVPTVPVADEELIAVLSAAVAMAESENSGMKFRVVSFRRV